MSEFGYRRWKLWKTFTIARVSHWQCMSWYNAKLFWQALQKYKSVLFNYYTQVVLDHSS